MSEKKTPAPNGWHGQPGVPLNPTEDGPHWLSWRDEKPRAVEWDSQSLASVEDEDKQGFWRFGDLYGTPEQVAADGWRYLGPVASHEKVAALEAENTNLRNLREMFMNLQAALIQENARLNDALSFYADKNSWRHTISLGHPQIDGTTSPAEQDRGKIARAALEVSEDG